MCRRFNDVFRCASFHRLRERVSKSFSADSDLAPRFADWCTAHRCFSLCNEYFPDRLQEEDLLVWSRVSPVSTGSRYWGFFFCTKRSQAYRPREAFHATSFTVTTSRLRSIFEPPLLHRRRASERGTSLAPSRGLTAVEAIPKAAQRARRSGPVEETPMTTTTLVAHAGSRCCCSTKSTDNRKNEPEKASATTARWTNR